MVSKFGESAIRAGLEAVQHKQQEARYAGHLAPDPRQSRPTPIAGSLPGHQDTQEQPQQEQENPLANYPQTVKVWPLVGVTAWQSKAGGAWRVWSLAHVLDPGGCGKVSTVELRSYCRALGLSERQRQRWVKDAFELGLFMREFEGFIFLASLESAAITVGASGIGRAAFIKAQALVTPGWKQHVWAGYRCSLENKLISQVTVEQVTGVSPRSQRNLQRGIGAAQTNYALCRVRPEHVKNLREITGRAYFVARNGLHVVQRLPDCRTVGLEIARGGKNGRRRKAQKRLNAALSLSGQGSRQKAIRLFHNGQEMIDKSLRYLEEHMPADIRPDEIFKKLWFGAGTNRWAAVQVGGGVM